VGYSPYYLVNGHEPLLPCDAFVLTFAYTAKPMSHEELLASRIQLLDRKRVNEAIAYQNVAQSRFKAAHRWNLEHQRTILEEDHQPGTLMVIRNSPIETSHSRKHQDRWLGPMVVVRRTQRGSYILAELSGEISRLKYAATREKRYHTRDGLTFPVQAFFNATQ